MSDRKLAKIVQKLFNQIWKLYRSLSKGLVTWLLRTAMLMTRRRRPAAGFVLPTTVFLILVVTLTTGALSYRAYNSSISTIGEVQNRIIYNAATPAIDRARAKMEKLFKDDSRYPGGVPSDSVLLSMMLNDGIDTFRLPTNPYVLADETPIDINGGGVDNAWTYRADSDGDGTPDATIIYSINFSLPPDQGGRNGIQRLVALSDQQKATGEVVGSRTVSFARSGPLSSNSAAACAVASGGTQVEGGWIQDATNTSILRKRFQVDAFVVRDDPNNTQQNNFVTMEFQQDRQIERANKWGAWFRSDLEIFPGAGAPFNFNGAMHSEGSIVVGDNFTSYLISAHNSCLFNPATNSEISVRERTGTPGFSGIIASGFVNNNSLSGASASIHRWEIGNDHSVGNLTADTDWADTDSAVNILLNPQDIQTSDGYVARGGDGTNIDNRIDDPKRQNPGNFYGSRFLLDQDSSRLNIDDTYRADDRLGPKSVYGTGANAIQVSGSNLGALISTAPGLTDDQRGVLTRAPSATDESDVGLDGYWERRARAKGLRVIVGERLELGNLFGWVPEQDRPTTVTTQAQEEAYLDTTRIEAGNLNPTDLRNATFGSVIVTDLHQADPNTSDNPGDPLYPPPATGSLSHEAQQRRALRDNLPGVQASAVYHFGVDSDYPVACLATTAHPGSPFTLKQSINFLPTTFSNGSGTTNLLTNFFTGQGTNGWEFQPPGGTKANFETSVAPGGALHIALQNLAHFAGDPEGAFPPKPGTRIRPHPDLTMWGNFSNLRQTLGRLEGGTTTYAQLSIADKSNLQTAACTLGMLAYNIGQIQQFNPGSPSNNAVLQNLAVQIRDLMDGDISNGEVLPPERLATYSYTRVPLTTPPTNIAAYDPRDYDRVTPEMFLSTLRQRPGIGENSPVYRLAELIHLHYQIRRDRTYGFRPSPASNTWNYNPFVAVLPFPTAAPTLERTTEWSSACDPNMFALTGTAGSVGDPNSDLARNRLYLSRLCGAVIPPGGVRDYPGDTGYPARSGSFTSYLPTPTSSSGTPAAPFNNVAASVNQAPFTSEPSFAPPLTAATSTYLLASVAPAFPSLYYIFPEFAHTHEGAAAEVPGTGIFIDHRQPTGTLRNVVGADAPIPVAFQPWGERYVNDSTVRSANLIPTAYQYTPVDTTLVTGAGEVQRYAVPTAQNFPDATPTLPGSGAITLRYSAFDTFPLAERSIAAVAVQPRASASTTEWALPIGPPANDPRNTSPNRIVAPDGTIVAVPFLDRVLFNGREWLPSRVLDIDLGLLRRTRPRNLTAGNGDEAWLPLSGMVYAFREDAVREDAVARPANGNSTNATNLANPTDPALVSDFSIKSVDNIPDPARRVHGFRLRNGSRINRHTNLGVPADENIYGMSFFSDNLAYIMGDFNLHESGAEDAEGNHLEEYEEQINDDADDYDEGDFYEDRINFDPEFARPTEDRWRPTEVLADTITILSNNFCDGSIVDTFTTAGEDDNTFTIDARAYHNPAVNGLYAPGCTNAATPSFLNQNRPRTPLPTGTGTNARLWQRENPADDSLPLASSPSPVKISRTGNALIVPPPSSPGTRNKPMVSADYGPPTNYFAISGIAANKEDTDRPLPRAINTRVNAVIVSGIVPSRENQSYGGLHNFPRFLEWWEERVLWFAGSFLQLNFSNYATAPYDQDAWEPGEPTQGGDIEVIDYYGYAPVRRWGYDVALQLAPAGPVAQRLVTPKVERNEFYTEPAVNDPYMSQLCRALPDTAIPDSKCPG